MKVIFERTLVAKGKGHGVQMLRKQVELPFAPWIGMEVEHPVLHRSEARFQVKHLVLSLGYSDDETTVMAYLGTEELDSKEEVEERVKVYEGHDWVQPGTGTHA